MTDRSPFESIKSGLEDAIAGRGRVTKVAVSKKVDGREYVSIRVHGVTTLSPEDFTFLADGGHDD